MHHSIDRSLVRMTTLAVLAVLAVAFAAGPILGSEGVATLGSPPPEEDLDPALVTPADPMDGMLDYAACMREHGIDMPDPQAGGGSFVMEFEGPADADIDPGAITSIEDIMGSDFVAADEACSYHLGAMDSDHDPALDAELMEQMLAHAECMRENGIDMDDPDVSGGAIAVVMDIDSFSDEYMAAEEACRDVSPFGESGLVLTEVGE